MFRKKDVIFSSGIGVCTVADIVNLSVNKSLPVQYYQLVSVYDQKKVSYIPVEEHQVELRTLITEEEATEKQKAKELPLKELQEVEYVLKCAEKNSECGRRIETNE